MTRKSRGHGDETAETSEETLAVFEWQAVFKAKGRKGGRRKYGIRRGKRSCGHDDSAA